MPTNDLFRVQQHFDRSAHRYLDHASMHAEVEKRVMERLEWIKFYPQRFLDLGCGPGRGTKLLRNKYPKAEPVALDLSCNMLIQARRNNSSRSFLRAFSTPPLLAISADMHHLPLADNTLDLLYSGICIHWSSDFSMLFSEFKRVLKPGGLLFFTTTGPDTLKELRSSWNQVDDSIHINNFPDMHDLGDHMLASGFSDPVTDMELFTLTYDSPIKVLHDLRAIGADTVLGQHRNTFTSPATLKSVCNAYEKFRIDDIVPSTWEVIYGMAWVPETKDPGSVSVEFTGL